jgi:AcrR family transcriptional regulator
VTRASFSREAPDVRRQALIDATAKCLAERGVGGVSVRAICAQAGVSAGLLTHYFSGIDALIVATYRDVGARVSQTLDQAAQAAGSDPRARLLAYVVASFQPPVLDPELLATWLAFWSLVKTDPAVAQVHGEIYAGYRQGIETLIGQCVGKGLGRQDIKLASVAITALVDGLWLELCLDARSFTPAEAERMAIRWVGTLLERPSGAA